MHQDEIHERGSGVFAPDTLLPGQYFDRIRRRKDLTGEQRLMMAVLELGVDDYAGARVEGGDVMPLGKGIVLIGMGERTTPQAVTQIAAELFRAKAASRVIACLMPKSRAAACSRCWITSRVPLATSSC